MGEGEDGGEDKGDGESNGDGEHKGDGEGNGDGEGKGIGEGGCTCTTPFVSVFIVLPSALVWVCGKGGPGVKLHGLGYGIVLRLGIGLAPAPGSRLR